MTGLAAINAITTFNKANDTGVINGFRIVATIYCPNHKRIVAILQDTTAHYDRGYIIEVVTKAGARAKRQPAALWFTVCDSVGEARTAIRAWDKL